MLVLPGGTMNMLAKAIHASVDGPAIVHAAAKGAEDIALPYVEAGPHRAFVALIVGPVAAWGHAREAVRAGRIARLRRAVRLAFHRSLSRGVTVAGAARARRRQHAVVLMPQQEAMEVSAIGFDGWIGIARLGMTWLAGDWRAAPHVAVSHRTEAVIAGAKTIHALFDGEEAKLPAPVRISHGHTRLRFITTRSA
jgi:diacylglycerol kinase family enzyme